MSDQRPSPWSTKHSLSNQAWLSKTTAVYPQHHWLTKTKKKKWSMGPVRVSFVPSCYVAPSCCEWISPSVGLMEPAKHWEWIEVKQIVFRYWHYPFYSLYHEIIIVIYLFAITVCVHARVCVCVCVCVQSLVASDGVSAVYFSKNSFISCHSHGFICFPFSFW